LVRYIANNDEEPQTLLDSPPAAYLVLLAGGQPSHSFPLRGEVHLGRDKDNAIVVADQKVSRHHAMLRPLDNTFIITDQGSANGTYLNGVQIAQPTRLKHQDRLTLGDTTFLFTIGQPELMTLEPSPPPLVSPLPPVQPAAAAALPSPGQNNRLLLGVLSCMALLILFLLLAMALLLGLIMGSSNVLG
jgi:hypothetical protein